MCCSTDSVPVKLLVLNTACVWLRRARLCGLRLSLSLRDDNLPAKPQALLL